MTDPDTKMNLSLDEIIKTNKKSKVGRGGGGTGRGRGAALIARKRQAFSARRQKLHERAGQIVKQRAAKGQFGNFSSYRGRGGGLSRRGRGTFPNRGRPTFSTGATERLVRKLVKKALVQGRGETAAARGRPSMAVFASRRAMPRRGNLRGRGRGLNRGRMTVGQIDRTGIRSRLGWRAGTAAMQKRGRNNIVNDRRGLTLRSQSNNRARRGRFGGMVSDTILNEFKPRRQRVLASRGRSSGRRPFRTVGGFNRTRATYRPQPRIELISTSGFGVRGGRFNRQNRSRGRIFGGGRGRGGYAFRSQTMQTIDDGGSVRGVRASFSHSGTKTTLDERFSGQQQQAVVRVGLKQKRRQQTTGRSIYF